MRRIELMVHGEPAPQGSKNVYRGYVVDASKKTKPWREAVVGEVLRQGENLNLHSLLMVRVTFRFLRPKAHYLKGGTLRPNAPDYVGRTPDLDKLCRSTLDGLVQAGVMVDDKQVVILHAQKVYVEESQGAIIVIEELP